MKIPYLVRSEHQGVVPGGVPAGTIASNDDDELAFSTRLTRLGLNLAKATPIEGLGDPELAGRIEIDFYNIGLGDSDSRAVGSKPGAEAVSVGEPPADVGSSPCRM